MGKKLNNNLKSSKKAAAQSTVFETVSLNSDSVFQRAVSILHTSYLDSASEHGFQYSQVTLVKNDIFLNEYKTFYQQKKASDYTQEELQETYGFLLFETENQARLVCQRGLCVGSSAITTLGDPAKGVYISKYSDYLHPRPWYNGKSGYIVIFNLIKGKVKFVPENYTTNYTRPSSGYDCHVATNSNKVSHKTSHFCAFELSQYYIYELSGNTFIERPRQICPSVIVAFQYREPKTMAAPAHKSILELSEDDLISSWKGKLIIQSCLLCDITLWSTYGAVLPTQIPRELEFQYVMQVSSLKKRLPEAVFRKQNYLQQKVCHQDMCFNLYEVELSNKQGEKIDKLTEYIKLKGLAIIKCLEDRGFFILLTSSALTSDADFEDERMGLHGLHLFHSSLPTDVKDFQVEDVISLKVIPILPALNCALLEAKKSFTEEGIRPNTLVKHNFQEFCRVDKSPSLTASSEDGITETTFFGKLSSDFDLLPPAEKCPLQSLTQLKSYFSDPSSYILEVSTALDLLAERPQSPCISDGICDAGFSLVMTPDPEFLDSEAEVRKEAKTETNSEDIFKAKKGAMVPVSSASNLRVQPKRKASMSLVMQSKRVNLCRPFPKRTAAGTNNETIVQTDSTTTLKLAKGQFPQKRKRVKGESASQPQSEVSSDGQGDVFSITTAQSENTTVAQKDLPKNSIVSYDSQALNMLADLALSSATSCTPLSEPRNLPCSSELPQNEVLLSKENSLPGTSDHEYHRGVKSQKGGLFLKPSSDKKSNSVSDLTVKQDEESLVSSNQASVKAQLAPMEETLETSDASQSSFVAMEHSYALLLAEHSKKHLQQRGVLGPVFAKNGTKGPEAGTPVGKVMPFRHQQNTSPLQKPFEDPFIKHKSRLTTSSLKDFFCSHTVFNCDGSFKVTFTCETEYVFSLDSKYTNNPLEKTVIRALHGPWNMDLPDNVEEVKLLLHMWVALFYSNQNKVIRSSRKVVEHSNPAKYVSINSTLESFEFSEIEESLSMERCSTDPPLETNETSKGEAAEMSFSDTNSLLPFNKSPPARGLELCVQNEQKEIFVREGHPDNPKSQNFIYSCTNEVYGKKAEQESSDKLKTSHVMLSCVESTQTNGPSISGEDKTFQQLDSTRVTSHNDANPQTTFTNTYGDNSNHLVTCQKSVYSTLESKVDTLHAAMQEKTCALQDLIKHSNPINKECQPSLERKEDNMGYVMINLEPVTLAFEKNSYVPIQTEVVNRTDKPTTFNMNLIKQASPTTSLRHPVSTFEKAQAQGFRNTQSLTMSRQKGTKYLCASSVNRETLAKGMCSLQKDIPLLDSSSPSDNSVVMEAVSIIKNSSYPLLGEEKRLSQDFFLQTQGLCSISSEEIIEPSQVEEVISTSASTILEKKFSLNCIPDSSLVLRKNGKGVLNSENMNFESFNSAFTEQTNLSMNREEVNLEFSEEDSDIDLTLTISPPTSPREQMPVDEVDQLEEAPLSNSELQGIAEEIIEPEEVTFIENREVNSTAYTSVYATVSEEPLKNKEREGDDLQPVTLILSKDNCSLEIAGEVNVTSDFPFNSLIEEVSPAASPDPEETQTSQAVSPGILKVHDTECEKNHMFSQIESIDLAITEKENSFVGPPTYSVGQDNLTWIQQMQLSAEMPLALNSHPGSILTLPGKVTEEIVQNEHDEVLLVSEKVQCCDTEVNQPALAAKCGDDFKPSLEKWAKSGKPLQPISIENRNLGLRSLVLEPPRKMTGNGSLADTFLSTVSPSGIVNMSLKQPTSPKSIRKNLFSSDLKTSKGNYLQIKSLNSDSIDGADITQAYRYSEIPKLDFYSDSAILTHCTRPLNIETGFQTQEISVVKMANLLKNSEIEAELQEESIALGGASPQSNTTSSPDGEQKKIHKLQYMSAYETTKDLSNGDFFPMYVSSYADTADTSKNTDNKPSSFVSKSFDSLVCGVSKEHVEIKSTSEGLGTEVDSESLCRDMSINVNSDICYEPLSGDSDQGSFGNCRNSKLDIEDSCTLRYSHTRKENAAKDDYDSFMSLSNSNNENWGYSAKVPGLKIDIPPRNWSIGIKKEDKCVPCYIQIKDLHGIPRTYPNFTITKEFKDTRRTLHSLRRHPSFTAECGLISSWTSTWQVADDLTQNTLDLEYLRFAHKLKQIVKTEAAQHSAPSTNVFLKESPVQIAIGAFPLTKISESPVLHPAVRSRSPLLVTVVHSEPREESQQLRSHTHGNFNSSSSFWKETCRQGRNHLPDSERNQIVSFHLNKLKYNSTLKESRNDISLILNEYAEFNKVMLNSNQVVFQDKELNVASGEPTSQEMYSSFSRRSASYEDMITDLCTNLHVKLKSVMKDACKSTFLFYLVETEDKSFFVKTKNILRKGGHTEMEPQHFCQAFHRENDMLIIIIRNEDISTHLHQIPSLLKLKHLPNVIFAGADSPEDVLDYTYQELFRSGGFVVSDDKILETLTLVQLKEMVKILEKLNGNGRWKWLLHHRENKKLKEDVRVDSIAHKKNLILKSCQSANIIELLHYHQCDSRSSTKAENLKCLLNLQIQHIDARFAVFLTDKPAVSREVFENSGILVMDANNFIENIQKVAAPFRSSYW